MLEINQTFARIDVNRTPENLSIETRNARLELHQKHAQVNVHTDLPKVEIDNYPAFASAGLRNNGDIINAAAQKGYQRLLAFIGKKTSDGHLMAAIENKTNAIAEIARRDSFQEEKPGFDYPPNPGPNITVRGGVQFDPLENGAGITNGVEGEFVPNEININYTPAQIRVNLQQYASINIRYQSEKVDTYI